MDNTHRNHPAWEEAAGLLSEEFQLTDWETVTRLLEVGKSPYGAEVSAVITAECAFGRPASMRVRLCTEGPPVAGHGTVEWWTSGAHYALFDLQLKAGAWRLVAAKRADDASEHFYAALAQALLPLEMEVVRDVPEVPGAHEEAP